MSAQADPVPYHVLQRDLERTRKLADELHLQLATQRGIVREQQHALAKQERMIERLRAREKRLKDPIRDG